MQAIHGIVMFAGIILGPLVVFFIASMYGAPWWAALIIAGMLGGLGTIIINLTATGILALFGIKDR